MDKGGGMLTEGFLVDVEDWQADRLTGREGRQASAGRLKRYKPGHKEEV